MSQLTNIKAAKPKSQFIKRFPSFITRKEFVEVHQNFVCYGDGLYISWRDYVVAYAQHNKINETYTDEVFYGMSNDTMTGHLKRFDYRMAMTVFVTEGAPGRISRFRRLLSGDFDYVEDAVIKYGVHKHGANCYMCGIKAEYCTHQSVSIYNPYGVPTLCAEHGIGNAHFKYKPQSCLHYANGLKCIIIACYRLAGTNKYTHCAAHRGEINGEYEASFPYCAGYPGSPCTTKTVATFGPNGTKKRILCKSCNIKGNFGYVDVVNKMCPGKHIKNGIMVTKQGKYNHPSKKTGMYCKTHAECGMIIVTAPQCKELGCTVYPSYGWEGRPARYCVTHKERKMVHLYGRRCVDCDKQPSFNIPTEKTPIYCFTHKKIGMVDVVSKKCELCPRQPSWAVKGSTTATRCTAHMIGGMTNIKAHMCDYPGCKKRASFAETKDGRAIRCADHRDNLQFNVKDKICEMCGLNYAKWGKETRTHCGGCRDDTMRLFSGRLCKKCKLREAIYNTEGLRPIYCSDCRLPGMLDTKNKQCIVNNCKTRAGYGPLFQSAVHCYSHATVNEYTNRRPVCEREKCDNGAIYAVGGNYPIVCEDHYESDKGYVNVVEKICTLCGKLDMLNAQTPICNTCRGMTQSYMHLKEKRIGDVLVEQKIPIHSKDSRVDDMWGGKERPDFVIDCDTHWIVVEVDEGQHKGYEPDCEMPRMVNIFGALKRECTIFVRYNPDNYIDSSGKRIYGKLTNPSRENKLIEMIAHLKENPTPGLWVVKLFYDGYDGTPKFDRRDYRGLPYE